MYCHRSVKTIFLGGARSSGLSHRFQGFALISVLSVLALLTLVAVAFLSLATVQVRTTRAGDFQAEAEANARLALMIAIGELQREMGPDQRVSATSDLAARTTSASREKQQYWTAVYRTTRENGEPFLTRDDLNGGLRDSRIGNNTWDDPINYLVSGNEGGLRTNLKIPYGSRFDQWG